MLAMAKAGPESPKGASQFQAVFVVLPDGSITIYDLDAGKPEMTAADVIRAFPDHSLSLTPEQKRGTRLLRPERVLRPGSTYYLSRRPRSSGGGLQPQRPQGAPPAGGLRRYHSTNLAHLVPDTSAGPEAQGCNFIVHPPLGPQRNPVKGKAGHRCTYLPSAGCDAEQQSVTRQRSVRAAPIPHTASTNKPKASLGEVAAQGADATQLSRGIYKGGGAVWKMPHLLATGSSAALLSNSPPSPVGCVEPSPTTVFPEWGYGSGGNISDRCTSHREVSGGYASGGHGDISGRDYGPPWETQCPWLSQGATASRAQGSCGNLLQLSASVVEARLREVHLVEAQAADEQAMMIQARTREAQLIEAQLREAKLIEAQLQVLQAEMEAVSFQYGKSAAPVQSETNGHHRKSLTIGRSEAACQPGKSQSLRQPEIEFEYGKCATLGHSDLPRPSSARPAYGYGKSATVSRTESLRVSAGATIASPGSGEASPAAHGRRVSMTRTDVWRRQEGKLQQHSGEGPRVPVRSPQMQLGTALQSGQGESPVESPRDGPGSLLSPGKTGHLRHKIQSAVKRLSRWSSLPIKGEDLAEVKCS